jgi:hypothetical protein
MLRLLSIISTVFVIMLLFCCTDDDEFDCQDHDFLPLALENMWIYTDGQITDTLGVFDTLRIDGELTYTFGPKSEGSPGYMRKIGTAIYQYGYVTPGGDDYIFDQPYVFVDFCAGAGTEWTVADWGTVQLFARGVTLTVPAGTFENCVHLKFDAESEISEMWFAPDVGPVQAKAVAGTIIQITEYTLN